MTPGRNFTVPKRRTGIYQTIRNFPSQFLSSWELVRRNEALRAWPWKPGATLYYAAMGGSSLPADLVNDYFSGTLRLEMIRDYELPEAAGTEDLVLAASFSGNTEETLAVFEEARLRRCRLIALSNGGQLEAAAQQAGIPWVRIPDCIQPRCATGYFFASILGILHRIGILETSPAPLFSDLTSYLQPLQEACEAKGKALAAALIDRVPIVYAPSGLAGVARIWKIKFNENCKIQSFSNVFPELNHNEMVGFTKLLMNPALIFLESRFMHPRVLRRMDVMQALLEKEIPIHRLNFEGEEPLHETFECLAVADYASYHLAAAYGIDPAPVAMVEQFKKLL